jgi:hypothetical protein
MNDADAEAAYARYYVPAPGRVVFQAAFANLNPAAPDWEAVADYALDWATRHAGAPAKMEDAARV